jgi:hypothetical protein
MASPVGPKDYLGGDRAVCGRWPCPGTDLSNGKPDFAFSILDPAYNYR